MCRLSEQEFVQRVARHRAASMGFQEIITSIAGMEELESVELVLQKLVTQVKKSMSEEEVREVKRSLLEKAVQVLGQTHISSRGAEKYRGFLGSCIENRVFGKEDMKLLVRETLIRKMETEGGGVLSSMTGAAAIGLLENLAYREMVHAEDVDRWVRHMADKGMVTGRKDWLWSRVVGLYRFLLGKTDPQGERGLIETYVYLLTHIVCIPVNSGRPQEVLDKYCLVSQVFQSHESVVGRVGELGEVYLDLVNTLSVSCDGLLARHRAAIEEYLGAGGDRESIEAFLFEVNKCEQIYRSPTVEQCVFAPLMRRLEFLLPGPAKKGLGREGEGHKKKEGEVYNMILYCMKYDEKKVARSGLVGRIPMEAEEGPLQALGNVMLVLDMYHKNNIDSLDIYMERIEVCVGKVLENVRKWGGDLQGPVEEKGLAEVCRLLIDVFHYVVTSHVGSIELHKAFFEVFSIRRVLERTGYNYLLMKFVPALNVKTKKLYNSVTNISDEHTSNVLYLGSSVPAAVRSPLKEVGPSE